MTPGSVFGNDGCLMRLRTTAPTATWPEYGSPRASAEIRRASRSTCELDAPPEPPELLELPPPADSPMAASVWSPALPSTVRPFFCWKARTARSVPLP